jgi:hypothetical protein
MKKLVFILTVCLVSSLFTQAQLNKPSNPQPDSVIKIIPFGDGRHTSFVYTIGGKMQATEDIQQRLLNYGPSADEYSKIKTNLIWGYISLGGMTASTIGAIADYAHNNKIAGAQPAIINGTAGFIYQHHSLTGAYILTGVAVGCLTSMIINFVNARKHSSRALQLYNHQFE